MRRDLREPLRVGQWVDDDTNVPYNLPPAAPRHGAR